MPLESEMMCLIFLVLNFKPKDFHNTLIKLKKPYRISELLARLFDSNCNSNSHTNHGVVTCADETHHLYIKCLRHFGVQSKKRFF